MNRKRAILKVIAAYITSNLVYALVLATKWDVGLALYLSMFTVGAFILYEVAKK